MDTLTHALSGALLARATAPRRERPEALPLGRRTAVGFLATAAPDLDFIVGTLGPVELLLYHRGVTHSFVMLPLWAWLLAHLARLLWRRDRPWQAYFPVTAMSIALHIAGDLITAYGTMIFAPLSDTRYSLGTTFIIDPWFTAVIVAALAASWLLPWRRAAAAAGSAALLAYVAFQWALLERAQAWGEQMARREGLATATVKALPRPVSPFNWMVIVADGDEVRYSFVNLARKEARSPWPEGSFLAQLDAVHRPLAAAKWERLARFGDQEPVRSFAREAWARPELAFFRWFAEEPVLYRVESGSATCAWFQDLRFHVPGRGNWPFRYGMCRETNGRWALFRLIGETTRVPIRPLR